MADFTESEYAALNAAIAKGVTEVRYGDRTVKYRSLDEMIKVKSMMARELGKVRRPNRVLSSFSKGLAK
jgi:hypothetical protein